MKRLWVIAIVVAIIALIIGVFFYVASRPGDISDRLLTLRDQLAEVENETDRDVRDYTPPPGTIDDLSSPIGSILKGVPRVKDVRVTGPAQPTKRLIHIAEWHLVSREAFRIDQEHARGGPLTWSCHR